MLYLHMMYEYVWCVVTRNLCEHATIRLFREVCAWEARWHTVVPSSLSLSPNSRHPTVSPATFHEVGGVLRSEQSPWRLPPG